MDTPTKRCAKCKCDFPATTDYFGFIKSKNRYYSYCRTCAAKRTRSYYGPTIPRYKAPDGYKHCNGCNRDFPATREYFGCHKKSKDNLYSMCKQCTNTKSRAYYYTNKDRILASERLNNQANPTYNRERAKRWAKANPDKVNANNRKWYREHPDSVKAKRQRYARTHPEVNIAKKHRYRAKKNNLPILFIAQDWQRALDYFKQRCAVCERPAGLWHTLAADHWIPLTDPNCPGTIPTNIIPLCHGQDGCNNSKGSKNAADWLVDRFGKRKAKAILYRIQDYFNSLK